MIALSDIIKQISRLWLPSVQNVAQTARMAEYYFLGQGIDEMKIRLRFMAVLTVMCCFFAVSAVKADVSAEEAPMFYANIEYSPEGYIVNGTFTEFPPDISRAETLYSLDGEIYLASGEEWNITKWSDGPWTDWSEDRLESFQNQTCLHSNSEPLKSYLAGELDRFYVKLRLTRANGVTYETQGAAIDRGIPRPIPEGMAAYAVFTPSMRVRTFRPFSYYGRYEITVREDMTPEEIAAFLPDTLPIEVQIQQGVVHIADGIVDCPVAWKPLENLSLTAGESITILDAAEEILVPDGTMLNTPLGTFQLDGPLGIDPLGNSQKDLFMDEVRLVLNVTAEDSSLSGALSCDFNGFSVAFHQKPTGASAIQAYTLAEGEDEWTQLPGLPLLEAVNAQPSTPGSGYTYVLDNTHELYRSFMAADAAGEEPSPFLIGIKIEGGVFDGQSLVLPWPETYDVPLALPKLGGSGGNEANAGSGNQGGGTPQGQRPTLPDSGNSEKNGGVNHSSGGYGDNSHWNGSSSGQNGGGSHGNGGTGNRGGSGYSSSSYENSSGIGYGSDSLHGNGGSSGANGGGFHANNSSSGADSGCIGSGGSCSSGSIQRDVGVPGVQAQDVAQAARTDGAAPSGGLSGPGAEHPQDRQETRTAQRAASSAQASGAAPDAAGAASVEGASEAGLFADAKGAGGQRPLSLAFAVLGGGLCAVGVSIAAARIFLQPAPCLSISKNARAKKTRGRRCARQHPMRRPGTPSKISSLFPRRTGR